MVDPCQAARLDRDGLYFVMPLQMVTANLKRDPLRAENEVSHSEDVSRGELLRTSQKYKRNCLSRNLAKAGQSKRECWDDSTSSSYMQQRQKIAHRNI